MKDMERATDRADRPSRVSRLAATAIGLIVAACGSATPATSPPTTEPPSAAPRDTPAATTSAAPSVAEASPVAVVIPDMPVEAALTERWESAGPALAGGWTWTPAVAPDGRIWAASSFDDTFWIFDADGTYLESWGSSGDGDGEFTFAAEGNGYGAIAFRPDGGFYVADSGNSRVQQFDAKRAFVRSFGTFGTDPGQFVTPIDIDLDASGNVYVYSDGRYDVQVFDADGKYVRTAATFVGPYAAVTPDGIVYATRNVDAPHLVRFRPDGSVDLDVDLSPMMSFATGLAVLPSGDIVVASSMSGGAAPAYDLLIQLDSDGTLEHVWPDGAEAVAVDATGTTLYLNYSNVTPNIRALALP